MKPSVVLLPLALLCLPLQAKIGEWRVLKDGEGGSVKARFEGLKNDHYLLRRESDGKLFEVSPGLLSPEDRTEFYSQASILSQELRDLGRMADHDLFSGTPFEERKATELAGALALPQQSKTKHNASWRLYASESYRLFGARPYSVALYSSEDGTVQSLSAVYANKGDFKSGVGSGEDHFNGKSEADVASLNKAMTADHDAILSRIKGVLGDPVTQRYGEGKARTTVLRWDWNGQSLLLSDVAGEYVSLSIVPLDVVNAGGKTAKIGDKDLKEQLRTDVVKNDNGDVYLGQIPMVDQGPKGYCVPATFERAMRTMGLDADMYMLAMVGQTAMGGGTSVENLLNNIRFQVRSKGRRTKDEKVKELKIRDVKHYIDEGIPCMWTLRSLKEYNEVANENTSKRRKVTD
ncbi:MAG: hypothetical protein JWO82_4022, partial [Akkermansiaceae bacterium]|nr:hypothetical protein [Akkermansiaceae bacterium]